MEKDSFRTLAYTANLSVSRSSISEILILDKAPSIMVLIYNLRRTALLRVLAVILSNPG